MAELSKEDLKKKIADSIDNNEIAIPLLEDIEDSFGGAEKLQEKDNKIAELTAKVEDLTKKYKERFLTSNVEEKKVVEEIQVEEKKPRRFEDLFNENGGLK